MPFPGIISISDVGMRQHSRKIENSPILVLNSQYTRLAIHRCELPVLLPQTGCCSSGCLGLGVTALVSLQTQRGTALC